MALMREEVFRQLKDVPRQLVAAFAVRCALRALPLLAAKEKEGDEPFWYWDKGDRPKYLLSLLRAIQLPLFFCMANNKIFSAATDAAAAAAAATTYAYAAATTTYADAYAAAAATYADSAHVYDAVYAAATTYVNTADAYATDDAVYAADAAYAVYAAATTADYAAIVAKVYDNAYAYAANAYTAAKAAAYAAVAAATAYTATRLDMRNLFEQEIRNDLTRLSWTFNQQDAVHYLSTPLWPGDQLPIDLKPVWQRFYDWSVAIDAGFEVWLGWYEERLAGKPIDVDLLKKQADLPAEVLSQGPKAVNAYLRELANDGANLKPLNQVRVIFIGSGNAGKTSLIRALHGETVIPGEEKMTPGIDIRHWRVPDTEIKAIFWDFGGQVVAHATHQFFLRERCLYVLVIEPRAGINPNDEAEYWLEHIKAFGKSAPVLIVGNKADQAPVHLDMRALTEKHRNISGFYPLSCTCCNDGKHKSEMDTFRSDLIENLQAIGTHQLLFSVAQFSILAEVRKRAAESNFLSYDTFNTLCSKYQLDGKGQMSREDYLGLLDKLGEVIHFPNLPLLKGYLLNPRWLTYGVYTLLYSQEIEHGELLDTQVATILKQGNIKDESGHLLDYAKQPEVIVQAMEEFQLCYRMTSDHHRLIIPERLPSDQPQLDFGTRKEGTLAFEFRFEGFLPCYLMPMLIVARHDDIKDHLVWKNGVILHNHDCQTTVRIQVDYHLRRLQIWIQGRDKREMLAILCDEVRKLIKKMDVAVHELLVLPDAARKGDRFGRQEGETISYQRLLAEARSGKHEIYTDRGNCYSIPKILGEVMTVEQQKQSNIHIGDNINVTNNTFGDNSPISMSFVVQQAKELADRLRGDIQPNIGDGINDPAARKAANAELNEGLKLLDNAGKMAPADKGKLHSFLSKIKDGTNQAIAGLNTIKGHGETIRWVMDRAAELDGLLYGLLDKMLG